MTQEFIRRWRICGAAAILAFLHIAHAEQPAGTVWLPAWATASAQMVNGKMPMPDIGPTTTTVVQYVHLTMGGTAFRIVLTNELGKNPLAVNAASVTVGIKSVPLAFHGASSVTIPPGQIVSSDPVYQTVAAFSDIQVTLCLPTQELDGVTAHPNADEFTRVEQDGSGAAAAVSGQTAVERPIWFFLKEVDVATPLDAATLVAFGDSITNGNGATAGQNTRYPDVLAHRLAQAPDSAHWSVVDEGISGNRLLSDVPGPLGDSAEHRFDRDVLSVPGVRTVIVLEGINDISNTGPLGHPRQDVTAAEIVDGLTQLAARAHAHRIRFLVGTLTPFGGLKTATDDKEMMREAVNDALRRSTAFDGVVDFDAAVRDPQPKRLLPSFDSGDHIHPSDAGYAAMAACIDLKEIGGFVSP